MISNPNHPARRLYCALVVLATSMAAHAQVITETFQNSTAPGWVFAGTGYTPTLTSGVTDPSGSGWLQLTNTGGNEATSAYYDTAFTAAGATVYATFNYQAYGGTGADGITFFLFDGSVPFSVGADGGSIGYAQKTGVNGLAGGYLGVALDEYGNFSSASEGRVGGLNGTTGLVPDAIAVRGPGSGTNGYAYLGGTNTLSQSIDSATRPTQTNTVQILISATNQLTVTLQQGGTSPQTVLQMDLSGYARPDTLKFGFASGTGGSTNIHDVNNLNVTTLVANLWSNAAGTSTWDAAGASTNTGNWNPTINPTTGADILFDNSFVTSNQTINVNANQTVRSISFDAPYNYTLNNHTITFDKGVVAGFSGIAVTQTHGTASDTINSNLVLNNAINIRNNATGNLSVTGAIATNGNTITLDGTGTSTTVSGNISGAGAIIKNDSGTDTLAGSNTYSGGTTINGGTLNANSSTALGSGNITLAGGTLGSTNSSTVANAIALTASSGLSNITTSGTLTETGGNLTLLLDNATQSGAVNLSNNTTARTLTTEVDSGTSTISGVIANGGGSSGGSLTKTGAGTLVLSGANTFTGTTTISDGTIQLGASDRLADTSAVNIGASGTLNLAGFSEKIGALTVAGGATLDFGAASGNNTFVFGTYTPPASGVLVVNNWVAGADTLATTVATGSQGTNGTQTINNSIYISGYGLATEATSLSTTIYGTNSAYLLTPAAQTWKYWDGSTTNWAGTNYWSSTASPTFTSTSTPNGQGVLVNIGNFNSGVSATPTLTGNTTLGGIRFDSAATQSYNVSGNSTTRTLTMSQAAGPAYIQQQSSRDQTISVGKLVLGSATVADITGSGNLTVSSAISGSVNLIKDGTGAGKLILTGNNSALTGSVYINNGVVQAANANALGTGNTTVSSGATLELSGIITVANAITAAGSGLGGAGAIHNVSGNNTLSGSITETGATTIAADSGTLLTLGGNITGTNTATTLNGAGNINVANIATGTGTVDINSTGNVTFNGAAANTYTGTTTVNSGTLILGKTAGVNAIAGDLVANGGTVKLTAANQIADTSSVTLNNSSTLNLNGNAETLGQLTSTSSTATVALGAGALTVSGPNNTNSNYAGTITGTAASSLTVNGTGKVYLSGNNSGFSGNVNVTNGTLNASGSNSVLGTGNVSISSSGNLQLQGGISVANNFTINGTGTSGNGAIENFAGNNAISGNITLGGNSRIQSDAGTLIVGQNVTLGSNTLTVGGVGTTSITGLIAGAGGLTKDGAGTLSLGNSGNTFAGATLISAGTVIANAANVFNNTAALTVATGASLSLQTYSEKVGSLAGAGLVDFGTSGILNLSSGSATFSGSFAGTGELIIGPGASLTLGANFNDPNLKITLAGGSLFLNGTNSTFGTLNITGNSILDFGNTSNSTLNVNNVTFSATNLALSVNNWTNVQDYFYSQNFTGATPNAHGSTPENQVVFSGFTAANTSWLSGDHQITPAPEPATYGIIFIGLSVAAVGFRRVRRNRSPVKAA